MSIEAKELRRMKNLVTGVNWYAKDLGTLNDYLYQTPLYQITAIDGKKFDMENPCLRLLSARMPRDMHEIANNVWGKMGNYKDSDPVPIGWIDAECYVHDIAPSKEDDHTVLDCVNDLLDLITKPMIAPAHEHFERYHSWFYARSYDTVAAKYGITRHAAADSIRRVVAYFEANKMRHEKPVREPRRKKEELPQQD